MNLLFKNLTKHPLMSYPPKAILLHPAETRIPFTLDTLIPDSLSLSTSAIQTITNTALDKNIVWMNLPTAALKKLGYSLEHVKEIRNSWVNAIAEAFDCHSTEKRLQSIHNKVKNPSIGWHKDNHSYTECFTTILYAPKKNIKGGHFELKADNNEQTIFKIPNNSNSYTILTLRDDLMTHRAQIRQPYNKQNDMEHLFISTHRFPSV